MVMNIKMAVLGPDDGGSKHNWNAGKPLPDYTAKYPEKQQSPKYLLVVQEKKTSVTRSYSYVKWMFHKY
jgi:hypothetical protein